MKKQIWIYFLGWIIFLLMHICMYANFRDDVVNISIINQYGSYKTAYRAIQESQSSRFIIDWFVLFFLSHNIWLFRIVDSFVYILIAKSINSILSSDDAKIGIAGALLFPISQMCACGWVTTSIVYMWTLCALLISIIWIVKMIAGQTISLKMVVVTFASSIFACNHEQAASIILGVDIICILFSVYKKNKFFIISVAQSLIACVMLAHSFLSVGNEVRSEAQIIGNMPDYYNKTLYTKLLENMQYTNNEYVFGFCIAVFLVTVFLACYTWNNRECSNFCTRVLSFLILVIILAFGLFEDITYKVFPTLSLLNNYDTHSYLSDYLMVYLGVFFWVGLFIALILSLEVEGVVYSIGILAGLCARLILVITPTYIASGWRTSIFLYMGLIITALSVYKRHLESNIEIKMVIYATVFLNMLSSFACV